MSTDQVLQLQRLAGNQTTARLLRQPAPPVVQREPPGGTGGNRSVGLSEAGYDNETTFVRHAIGAWETNALAAGVTVHTAGGVSVTGLSDSAFTVGPFDTDMGHYFYVYRFTDSARAESKYSFSRGMSTLSWNVADLKKSLPSVKGTKTLAVNATGLVSGKPAGSRTAPGQTTPGSGGTAGGTKPAGERAAGGTGTAEVGAPAEAVPVPEHQRLWIQAGRQAMAREYLTKLSSLQKLRASRIASWQGNTSLKDPKPIRTALEIAITITASGFGGVVGNLLSDKISGALLREFVKSSAKKGTEIGVDRAVQAALASSKTILTKQASPDALGEQAKAALASKGDLISCFAEGQTLSTISEEAAQATAFNLAEKGMSDIELADQVFMVTSLFKALSDDANAYLAQLSMGLLRLMDEVYLGDEAKDYGGDRAKLYAEDSDIDETDERSGNLLVLPVGTYDIGKYYAPDLAAVTGFRALGSKVNNATLAALQGTKVGDLPFTLAFRFWGLNPYSGFFQDVFSKVWFVRRGDGTVVVDFDDADDDTGLEWLSSYALGVSRELSDSERKDNSAKGARKLYEAIKDRPLLSATNSDIF